MSVLMHWREGLIGFLALGCGVLYLLLLGAEERADKWQTRAIEEQVAHKQTVANYRAKAEQARLADAAHKARVESDQIRKTQEIRSAYQNDLAALCARLGGMWTGKASADSCRARAAPVPRVPGPAPGTDGTTPPDPLNEFNAAANALQLQALQDWVKQQQAIPR